MERKDFEIMAPVGSWESLVAAVQGGSLGETSAWTEESSGMSYEEQAYDYMMMANANILTDYETDY